VTALLDHLWQSTLFALPLGALTLLLRRHAASLRFWLWFAASVKFLVPFSVLMVLGGAVTLPVVPMRRAGCDYELDHVADRDVGGRHASGAADLGDGLV